MRGSSNNGDSLFVAQANSLPPFKPHHKKAFTLSLASKFFDSFWKLVLSLFAGWDEAKIERGLLEIQRFAHVICEKYTSRETSLRCERYFKTQISKMLCSKLGLYDRANALLRSLVLKKERVGHLSHECRENEGGR